MNNNAKSNGQAADSNPEEREPFNLAWAITGAGDLMPQTFKVIEDLKKSKQLKITAILSKAAVKVTKMYRLWEKLPDVADKVLIEEDSNTPFVVGALQTGKYDLLLVAPATANSVAKIVHGIADTLITNAVAMTNKTDIQVFILPVEKERETVVTKLPDGKSLRLYVRELDAENTARLRKMKGVNVLESPEDIVKIC